MRDALAEALDVACADPEVSVRLMADGPVFCSGGDLDEFGSVSDPAHAHEIRMAAGVPQRLAALAPRVSAHVHGASIGAGVELTAFAGTVVAAPDATFRLPELAMGLIPGAGGTVSLPRRIGRQRTAWLALTGVSLDARAALRWGLIDAVR
jgi:enoyl-CoA hydratase/carnithine racemase